MDTKTSNANSTASVLPKALPRRRTLWIFIVIAIIFGFWAISAYNALVRQNEAVTTQWAQVESQYQRRFDLIPNLVESVKGVLAQEQEIFISIANARQGYAGATTIDQKVAAANQVESSLGRLLAIVENYPQLKSSETMQTLLVQLEGTENRIATERGRYNEAVMAYNLKVKAFPGSLFASMFGFEAKNQFTAVEGADTAPAVNFQ